MIFKYKALDSKGKERTGKIDALNAKTVIKTLQSMEMYTLEVTKSSEDTRSKDTKKKYSDFFKIERPIPKKLISAFSRQFAIMVETGIPYNRALEILIKETNHKKFQTVLSGIRELVVEGNTLASAISQYPKIFSKMYISVVRAGEASGKLAHTLTQQANFQDEQETLKSKVQAAMIYPSILMLLGIGIMIFMVQFILPKIIPIFESFEVDLPLPTRLVIMLSSLLSNYGAFMLLFIGALLLCARIYLKRESGRRKFHALLLKTPILNTFLHKLLSFKFVQSLGALITSGVQLRESLNIVKGVTGNLVYSDYIEQITDDVTQKGYMLSQAIKRTDILNEAVTQMIRIGEESGRLESMMVKVSNHLEKEVQSVLEKVVSLLEPLIILFMAVGIGFIILSVILPIFEMNQLVRR